MYWRPWADGDIPDDGGGVVERLIVTGQTFFTADVREIDARVIAVGGFEVTGSVIDSLRTR